MRVWVGCEVAVRLLGKQEQDGAHGGKLAFEAIEASERGSVLTGVEIVRNGREPGEKLTVDLLCPAEDAHTQRGIIVRREIL